MFKFLIKRFVKNPDQTSSSSVMFSYALLCSIVGIVLNGLLFGGKLFAGSLAGSVTITADAFNNLSDAVVTFAAVIGFWMASYGPGKEHPFGHGRYEWITGLFAALLVIFVGFQLVVTSIQEIIEPSDIDFDLLIAIILIVSIILKLYMYAYNHRIGKLINSVSLQSTAADCLSDAIATSAVLVASVLQFYMGWHIDGFAGILVSVLIIRAGLQALSEVIKRIIGHQPDQAILDSIDDILHSHEAIEECHDLLVHDYGFGRYVVTMRCSASPDKAKELDAAINDVVYQIRQKGHTCFIEPEYLCRDTELESALVEHINEELATHGNQFLKVENVRTTQDLDGTGYVCLNLLIPVTVNHQAAQFLAEVEGSIHDVAPELRCMIDTLAVDDFFGKQKLLEEEAEAKQAGGTDQDS